MSMTEQYSPTDKLVHRLVFARRSAQLAMSGIEDSLFRRQLEPFSAEKPVFVTAMPRAGTTLLIELLEGSGEFGVHTYRDMPMLLAPLFWSKISRRFHRNDTPRERAHGDGMMVSTDSPEAFEESIWALFWRDQYQTNHVEHWNPRLRHKEFEAFYRQHMRKILLLRQSENAQPRRYLSKNNMNICRIEYMAKVMPDATFLIPFRHPLQHAASLLNQHRRFLDLHRQDPFARRYMRDIGHFDFGANLKPINFDNWLAGNSYRDTTALPFWLRYWTAAYSHLLRVNPSAVHFFSFDQFINHPVRSLTAVTERLDLSDRKSLVRQSQRVGKPKRHTLTTGALPPDLLDEALRTWERLERRAINLRLTAALQGA